MKKVLVLLLSVITVFALCIPVFASDTAQTTDSKDYYPVQGSWKLAAVYDAADAEKPVLLEKESAQSLYGAGTSILTFDGDGYAHDITFDGEDISDAEASWKTTSPNKYVFEENGMSLTFVYNEKEDALHRSFSDDTPDATYKNLDFVYYRAIAGSWKLDKVIEVHEGDAPVDLPKEGHQSLYSSENDILTFINEEKKTSEKVHDGSDTVIVEGTWEMTEPDVFIYKANETEMKFNYFRVDDTLFRDVKETDNPDQPYVRFIYKRYVEPAKTENTEAPAAVDPRSGASKSPETQPAKDNQSKETKADDEEGLIADGKIFTGRKLTVYDPNSGNAVTLSELNQGGWANESTGVIYEQEGGGGDHFYGNDGSVLVTEYYYFNVVNPPVEEIDEPEEEPEEELIADGQIFNDSYITVYDYYGNPVTLRGLNQGGWANEYTGVVYQQEGGGGDHFYGNDGSELVTEYYYYNVIQGEEEE